jgi:hypothetical protein
MKPGSIFHVSKQVGIFTLFSTTEFSGELFVRTKELVPLAFVGTVPVISSNVSF